MGGCDGHRRGRDQFRRGGRSVSADPRAARQGAGARGRLSRALRPAVAPYPGRCQFTIVGTAEFNEALTDQTRFSNAAYEANLGTSFGMGSISVMDNPQHGRFRKIFQKIFLP
jgi:cytochrome P450